jgi:hypothetical protein
LILVLSKVFSADGEVEKLIFQKNLVAVIFIFEQALLRI